MDISIILKNDTRYFKGRVQCFSMQVVINKCFLLNFEKIFSTDPFCRFEKNVKNYTL